MKSTSTSVVNTEFSAIRTFFIVSLYVFCIQTELQLYTPNKESLLRTNMCSGSKSIIKQVNFLWLLKGVDGKKYCRINQNKIYE